MKSPSLVPLAAAVLLTATFSLSADVLVQYSSAKVTSLPPIASNPNVTPTNLLTGSGISLTTSNATGFNYVGWDPANRSFADAVADDDVWTWGFTVDNNSFLLTTLDIRLGRTGTGPQNFEIKATVWEFGIFPGTPVSLLTHDYGDSDSGVSFENIDLSALPTLRAGDYIEFTLAAFNSESASGGFDLETITPGGTDGIVIHGTDPSVPPLLSVFVSNFNADNGTCLPLVNQDGFGISGSWAVGTIHEPLWFIDDPEVFANQSLILGLFHRFENSGGAFLSTIPGFFSSSFTYAGIDSFVGSPIMIVIGNNPLGLNQSTHFIVIDSGERWEPVTPGVDTVSINLANENSRVLLGEWGAATTAFPPPFSECEGVRFTFPIASGGGTLTSLIDVAEIPNSQGKGGLRVIFGSDDPDDPRLTTLGWRLPGDGSTRAPGAVRVGLDPGIYPVQFSEVSGFDTPPDWGLEVVAGQLREYRVTYEETPPPYKLEITFLDRSVDSIQIGWRSQPFESYAIDYSTTLQENDWAEIAAGILSDQEDETSFLDTLANRLVARNGFYRIRKE